MYEAIDVTTCRALQFKTYWGPKVQPIHAACKLASGAWRGEPGLRAPTNRMH